jgi:hypothetical protein
MKEKKAKKLKKGMDSLRKDVKIKGQKLSKHDENQALLSALTQKRADSIIDSTEVEKTLSRTFVCKCGCEVKLHGNIDSSIKECSRCQKGEKYETMAG